LIGQLLNFVAIAFIVNDMICNYMLSDIGHRQWCVF